MSSRRIARAKKLIVAGLPLAWWFYRYSAWRKHALAEAPEEAREQIQADGEPAGRMVPDV